MVLRMVEEMLATRGISVTPETIRQWGLKFGRELANRIRRRASRCGDKWPLDEVVIYNSLNLILQTLLVSEAEPGGGTRGSHKSRDRGPPRREGDHDDTRAA